MKYVYPAIFLLILSVPSVSADASHDATREQIISHWKAYWGAIENLEVEFDECVVRGDEGLERDPSLPLFHYSLVLGSRGRRAIKCIATKTDGKRWSPPTIREDGRQTCAITFFEDDPESLNFVVLRPQVSTNDVYVGPMCHWLWFMMPGGRRPEAHLANKGTLEMSSAAEGGVRLHFDHKGAQLICELDETHDWLPRKVLAFGGQTSWEVTRFQKEGGLYFPAEGLHKTVYKKGSPEQLTARVKVTRLKLNGIVPASTFAAPSSLAPGVWLHDEARHLDRIEGGVMARDRLLQLHHADPPKAGGAKKILASIDPTGWPWVWIFVAFSTACIALAVFLKARSRLREPAGVP